MVIVDKSKCVGCGLCVKICHEGCITLDEGTVAIHHELCSTCTQCIAICPQQALSWDQVPPTAFDPASLPSPTQMAELLKERRSIRFFKADRLDRALIEEIVGYGIDAPTNNYALRAIVVDDPALIQELDQVLVAFVKRIYRLVFKSAFVFNFLRKFTPADPKDKVKMEETLERGHAFHHPPAVVSIVGDRRIALTSESAQYALYNMVLYAQSRGIGSCRGGASQIFLDRSRTVRERLGLQKHEHIMGGLGLGYPAVSFRNKVEGKRIPIQWNGR